ncbi:MAG: type IV secretion system DNA-binding domain-containing protein [Candidatus Pacebacteria bacterium]|nr:type IV secretion system DNA-binding domain-containing protein [Candidatus Paceibacterota bacterium]
METDITYFAKTNFREKEHVFGAKKDDRRRHAYVIGKTGMGKTNLLETMIIADIRAGNGVAVVDPHGDLAEKILNFVPASRINDVIYFDPADADYPIAFNVMEHVDPKYRHLVASGLIGVFKKIWADSWGPRLEYLLRNVILALLEYPGSTLLGVPRMFIDKDYRKKVVSKVTDPVVKAFWLNEFTKYSSQFTVDAISPIQNKVGQFLSSSLVRNIISQTHSTIDMREIMDNKKILIINLAKGKIGEDYSALLGAMLITKIQLAAMGRSNIPEEERKDFYLYVDEFQNFATESFAGILSEARKYRLNLIVAHQYIGQLEEEVRDAIFGNVGTIITFRVGAADAEFLEKEFEPVFMMNDLVNLAKYDIYLKLMIDGVTGDAFSATTLPPSEVAKQSSVDKIIRVSRERYANKREVVEEKISRWSGMNDENKKAENGNNNGNSNNKKGNEPREIESKDYISKNEEKEMWDAVCEMCGEKIRVPFKPDPKRSTYCKNCLVEVRKQVVESAKNNKVDNANFEKKAEEREVYQTEKKKIKTIDSQNGFVGRDVSERKEKPFAVSDNFSVRKMESESEPKLTLNIENKGSKDKNQESKTEENNVNLQKKDELRKKMPDAIIEDDSSQKNISMKKISQPNHKDLPKDNNLEIKEGEVVKF